MLKNIILASLALTIVLAVFVTSSDRSPAATAKSSVSDLGYEHATVTIGGKVFDALISDSETLRERGLGGRDSLKNGQAMLFVFDTPDSIGIWMKDMKFPIDIVWLDSNYRIVSFEKNVSPDSYPKIFFPSAPAQYVIELPAGTLSTLSVQTGDKVSISGGK